LFGPPQGCASASHRDDQKSNYLDVAEGQMRGPPRR
jgi:hypothetical protein